MASAEEICAIRLEMADSEENKREIVWESDTALTSGGAKATPTGESLKALPFMGSTDAWADQDSKIMLLAKAYVADTLESEESNGLIPILLKNIRTGAVTQKILKLGDANGDFANFNATHDVAIVTARFTVLGSYTVPKGFMASLDPSRQVHVYLGDDTA